MENHIKSYYYNHLGSGTNKVNALTRQSDNKIIAAGEVGGNIFAIRFGVNSLTPDPNFSGDGYLVEPDLGGSESIKSVAINPSDNGIMVAGVAKNDLFLAKYNSAGNHDTSFFGGSNWYGLRDISGGSDKAAAISFYNNQLILGGTATVSSNSDIVLMKLLAR